MKFPVTLKLCEAVVAIMNTKMWKYQAAIAGNDQHWQQISDLQQQQKPILWMWLSGQLQRMLKAIVSVMTIHSVHALYNRKTYAFKY